jgi:hypothetical protein
MLARRSLWKHFKVWVNELLFLSIFGEAPTGRIVTSYLYPNSITAATPAIPNDFASPIHARTVNLDKFRQFVTLHCKQRDTILLSPHVHPQCQVIQQLARSIHDIWGDNAPLAPHRLRKHYLDNYAALPSNTHGAESCIKDTNYSQLRGRNENLSSTYSTARSGLTELLNKNYIAAFKDRFIKGTTTVTEGNYGERYYKRDGSAYIEKETHKWVDGFICTQQVVRMTVKRHTSLAQKLTLEQNTIKWNELRLNISGKENQFEKARVAVKVEEFDENYTNNREPNALQHLVGQVEIMPLLEGKVTYDLLQVSRDKHQRKTELRFWELSDEGGWKNDLLPWLKQDEKNRGSKNTKNFLPLSPDVNFQFIMEGEADDDGNVSDDEEQTQW